MIVQAGNASFVVVSGIAAGAEAGIAAEQGIGAAEAGKLLEPGTAGVGFGIPVDGAGTVEGSAEAVRLVFGQMAQTGQTHQSLEYVQIVVSAVEPFGIQRIQTPVAAAAFGQLDQQTGWQRWHLRTASKLSLSSAVERRQ